MTRLYQRQQIYKLEQLAVASGVDAYDLMFRAGKAAFTVLRKHWPTVREITVCCGKGNNGGDGLVFAYLAHREGLQVTIYSPLADVNYRGPAAQAVADCKSQGLSIQDFPVPLCFKGELIVDALLGSGLKGAIKLPYSEIIAAINKAKKPVLSIDVPSGVNINTGEVRSEAVKADLTITFVGLKQGLYTAQAPDYCGKVVWNALGIPDCVFSKVETYVCLLDWPQVRLLFPPRRERNSHKGDYGHVLVIGGDYGMGGSVRMAAEAAARVGAGLVTVATRPEHIPIVSGSRPELMCYQIAEADNLDSLFESATVIVIGPGLGKSSWAKSLLDKVLRTEIPKVLDADSLNLLADNPIYRKDWVLTPHPGEASRLLRVSCQEIQSNRFKAIRRLARNYGGVIVLKGVGTLIKGKKDKISICPSGNPGMSTGGMGDVLSGVIGGLLAQRFGSVHSSVQVGVFIHSLAADRAAQEGGERGLLATDLFSHLRVLVNRNEE
ncbi:NAD(P)H-hydrate dehydratase [Coxiella endosymbiont of Amblyomma sculptum]|uniref:NAD(P)H-hydrate dehydratase n=1 Tax=Coxiella endosymbiont of Amblyomma sculptum TaxID=2487929 RepID=UPI00132EABBE|nr:NAD(P)H-hydrate dehydratase [Coxiella endosymbiont of Amblyomma sculptum]QHG92580.1 NAD(P)H-hydrate dehydratase [Coxiella endosymbiont of Amblyomma sculptum]